MGKVLHELVDRARTGKLAATGPDPEQELSMELERLVSKTEWQGSASQEGGAPLLEVFSAAEWRRVRRRVLDLAHQRLRGGSKRTAPTRQLSGDTLPPDGVWSELSMHSPLSRLSGRADFVRIHSRHVEIRDQKTGRTPIVQDQVSDQIKLQMRLYGVLARDLGAESVELWVDANGSARINFDERVEADTREWLRTLLSPLPAGSRRDGEKLAEPGADCRWCQSRPICQTYLQWAPDAWKQGSQFELPYDTWGQVAKAQPDGPDTIRVSLTDKAERAVKVFRVSAWRVTGLEPGSWVSFFGLKTSDHRSSVTQCRHPCNFHEKPLDRRDARAWTLEVWGG